MQLPQWSPRTSTRNTSTKKSGRKKTLYNAAKVGVLIIGLASVVFALTRPTALADLLVLSNGGVKCGLSSNCYRRTLLKRATKEAALASIIIGEVCMISMTFIFKIAPFGLSGAFLVNDDFFSYLLWSISCHQATSSYRLRG